MEVEEKLKEIVLDKTIGIIIVTEKIANTAEDAIDNIKANGELPLIVEIPDRHLTYNSGKVIEQYINRTIGV